MQTTVAKPKPEPKPAAAKGDASEAKARSSAPAKEAASAEAQRRATGVAAPSGERHQNEGHGRRLTMAFEALEAFPALAESRDRLTRTARLNDGGKLVLMYAYPGYPAQVHRGARTPEDRVHRERRELGVDHALVGGVLIRRWGLPPTIATTIERHHNPEVEGEAAFIRLGDMLADYEQGAAVSPSELPQAARTVGLGPEELRRVMYELPTTPSQRRRHVDPCPLSARELGVLQRLAEGKVYKQIAHELTLSTSTVRTHLHNIYGKLGAVDSAQTVLIATERVWL